MVEPTATPDLRSGLERSVPSLATSIDARTFSFACSLHDLELGVGGYVALDVAGTTVVGQILRLELGSIDPEALGTSAAVTGIHRVPAALGDGTVLSSTEPFHDAPLRPATEAEVASWLATAHPRHAALEIGALSDAPGLVAALDAGGFSRHSFLCGQSGSGKTYSMGVILERLLLETSLRIVILDPNSDYVRLSRLRTTASGSDAERFSALAEGIKVLSANPDSGAPLVVRASELGAGARAALLGLDPVADRDEYAALTELLDEQRDGTPLLTGIEELLSSDLEGARALGLRAKNLGVLDWRLWERGAGGSLPSVLASDDWRCLVVDLGSLDTPEEQAVVAELTLDTLWRNRRQREPVLIVIDEAHNVCPQATTSRPVELATSHAIQIAGEGRKFGLYLLVATQRPQKVHDNVLSQCDNLVLMRMNSAADLAHLGVSFSFVPAALLAEANHFGLGEALVAGKISPTPTLLRFGARLTEEGGGDVDSAWSAPRPLP
jgi:DNA helicase HerA-like ATPase